MHGQNSLVVSKIDKYLPLIAIDKILGEVKDLCNIHEHNGYDQKHVHVEIRVPFTFLWSEDPETGDVLLLGGQEKIAIYRLSDVEGEWILQKETLMEARKYFSALVVPAGILNCDKSSSKIDGHDEL